VPRLDQQRKHALRPIEGAPPHLAAPPVACPFAPRCSYRVEQSTLALPPLLEIEPGHHVACFNPAQEGEWAATREAIVA
jgi:oligopeptide/dipeptide ABC transporter ATP-binding protein